MAAQTSGFSTASTAAATVSPGQHASVLAERRVDPNQGSFVVGYWHGSPTRRVIERHRSARADRYPWAPQRSGSLTNLITLPTIFGLCR